jgi:hypothetical protein
MATTDTLESCTIDSSAVHESKSVGPSRVVCHVPVLADRSGCCFSEYKFDETTHCGNAATPHRFCLDCARRHAQVLIGDGK